MGADLIQNKRHKRKMVFSRWIGKESACFFLDHRNCALGGLDACADAFEPFDLAAHVHAK